MTLDSNGPKPTSRLDRVVFRALLTAVALSPLPFGSAPAWAWSTLALAVGGLLVAWSRARMLGTLPGLPIAVGLPVTAPLLLCLVLLLAWVIVQTVPGIVPLSWRNPLWQEASEALGEQALGGIGLDPGNALAALVRLGTYSGIFWLALQYGREPVRANQVITLVAAAGAAYALYGLVVHFMGSRTILWFDKDSYGADLTSTFVNRNNYATYAGLGWLCLLALIFKGLNQKGVFQSSRVEWFSVVFNFIEQKGWCYLLGALILASALLTSHSRGGLLSTIFSTVVFCLSLQANTAYKDGAAKRFGLFALALASLCIFAGGSVVEQRFAETDSTKDDRTIVYSLTIDAIKDHPLVGTGLGTFEEAFRFYRTLEIRDTFAQAHNSYLEAALELGIPATALILTGLFGISLVNLWGAHRRRRDAVYPCLGLAATALVAAHSVVDFSIQIPAVAATYAAVLGVSLAQSWSSRTNRRKTA